MRITGGKARSIALKCPKADWVRPATDRMRESVFSTLGIDVEGAVFLDLFAGAGTYGLEAISRGAKEGVFVEQHRLAVQSIQQNLKQVAKSVGNSQHQRNFRVDSMDALKWLENQGNSVGSTSFDVIFIDPPYEMVSSVFDQVLCGLVPLLNREKGAWILFEAPELRETFPTGYALRKTFGKGREDTRAMLLSWLPNR